MKQGNFYVLLNILSLLKQIFTILISTAIKIVHFEVVPKNNDLNNIIAIKTILILVCDTGTLSVLTAYLNVSYRLLSRIVWLIHEGYPRWLCLQLNARRLFKTYKYCFAE